MDGKRIKKSPEQEPQTANLDDIQLSDQSEKASVNVSYLKNSKPSKYVNPSSSDDEDGEITSSKSIVKDKNTKIQEHYFPAPKKKEKIQNKPNKMRSISFDMANKRPPNEKGFISIVIIFLNILFIFQPRTQII